MHQLSDRKHHQQPQQHQHQQQQHAEEKPNDDDGDHLSNIYPIPSEMEILRKHGYKLSKKIGEGSYSKVYLGEFQMSDKNSKTLILACKVINLKNIPEPYAKKYLPREFKLISKLQHPYIIPIHSIFRRKYKYFTFMSYAERGDLLNIVKKDGPLDEDQSRIWVRQIALALQYLHIQEIAHRDIKCDNILITAYNTAKLTDFGFARNILNEKFEVQASSTYCGSFMYLAPEILKKEPYEPKSVDLWALGVVIYTMVNRSYPFGPRISAVLYKLQTEKQWKFRSKGTFSKQMQSLVSNLLEPNIKQRYNIKQVLDSDWIAMDHKLKELNIQEYKALRSALEQAGSFRGRPGAETYDARKSRLVSNILKESITSHNTSLHFMKKYSNSYEHLFVS